jgi:hypothetical protein
LSLLLESLDDFSELTVDVRIKLGIGEGEVEFLAEGNHHAAEVLADELVEELWAGVAVRKSLVLEDFICKLGAGLEGKLLREDERIVAIEENGGCLFGTAVISKGSGGFRSSEIRGKKNLPFPLWRLQLELQKEDG